MNLLLEEDPGPIVKLEVKVQHFIADGSILVKTAVHDHILAEDGSRMVLSWLDGDAFGLDGVVSVLHCVVDQDLTIAFSDLSLLVVHEAAAEGVDQVVVGAARVSTSSIHLFC